MIVLWVLDLWSLSETTYVHIDDQNIISFFSLYICHICFGIIIIALAMYYIVIVHP